ncbi:unnamed protein product [Orchesella dallaii]|uniref:ShKT domain-containing protein n=1 Tax=Orchesella dallaii TaxID=48710 RepID=A0ABP1S0K1_9HEXA
MAPCQYISLSSWYFVENCKVKNRLSDSFWKYGIKKRFNSKRRFRSEAAEMGITSRFLLLGTFFCIAFVVAAFGSRCSELSDSNVDMNACSMCTRASGCVYYVNSGNGSCISFDQVPMMTQSRSVKLFWSQQQCGRSPSNPGVLGSNPRGNRVRREAEICKDDNTRCPNLALRGECDRTPDYMLQYCKLSCKVCATETCKDNNTHCRDWAIDEQCYFNSGYMLKYCKLSCRVCLPVTCEDVDEECVEWAANDECSKNPAYMLTYCRKSCRVCDSEMCVDKHEYCDYWGSIGECSKNPDWMLLNCMKSCKLCRPEPTFTSTENPSDVSESEHPDYSLATSENPGGDCSDVYGDCLNLAAIGVCSNNPEFSLANCRNTCNLCDIDPEGPIPD